MRPSRSGELIGFHGLNNLVNAAALLLADGKPSHKVDQPFVAGLVAVDESLNGNQWIAGTGYLNTVSIDLDHYGHPTLCQCYA